MKEIRGIIRHPNGQPQKARAELDPDPSEVESKKLAGIGPDIKYLREKVPLGTYGKP
jgi:hypothetical protein